MRKTYRATKDGLKVGNSVRNYGDLVPEASDWPNIGVWISEGYIESCKVSDADWSRHLKKFPMTQNRKPGTAKKSVKIKRVAAKKTAPAKKVVRITKKGKSSGGRQLAEHSV